MKRANGKLDESSTKLKQRCSVCKKLKLATAAYFYRCSEASSGLQAECKKCSSARLKIWYNNNPKKVKEKGKIYRDTLRFDALSAYCKRQPECACCGENELKFLCIDHIYGNGAKHRKELLKYSRSSTRLYYWLKASGYPKGFQVLCHNCNMAKGFYGKCPHKEE